MKWPIRKPVSAKIVNQIKNHRISARKPLRSMLNRLVSVLFLVGGQSRGEPVARAAHRAQRVVAAVLAQRLGSDLRAALVEDALAFLGGVLVLTLML